MSISIEKRPTTKGENRFRAQVRVKGFPSKSKTFHKHREAKVWAEGMLNELKSSSPEEYRERRLTTIPELFDWYRRYEMPRKAAKTIETQVPQLERWAVLLGDVEIKNVTSKKLKQIRRDLVAGDTKLTGRKITPSTINRYYSALSAAFTAAVKEEEIISNPAQGMGKLKEPRGITRFLSEDEVQALLASCEQHPNRAVASIVNVALYTGMRKGEILWLRWKNINFELQHIYLPKTKNGDERYVPLSTNLQNLLSSWKKPQDKEDDLLFPAAYSKTPEAELKPLDIKKGFAKILNEANIKNFRFHDLRHTAASYLAMSGCSLLEIATILGHKDLKMVQRYAHLSNQHTLLAIEKSHSRMIQNTH